VRQYVKGDGVRRGVRVALAAVACVVLANCSSSDKLSRRLDPRYGVASSPRVVEPGEPVPKGGGTYRVGKPYMVAGQTYVPEEDPNYRAEGLASWYGDDFHGRLTANGEVYDTAAISAAHPTLPMPSYVRVTNLANKKSLVVRVNDRGPYHRNRVIDLSLRAAHLLDFHGDGVARVRVEYIGRAPLEGSDDTLLAATLRNGVPAPAPSMVMLASAKPFLPQGRQRVAAARGIPLPPDRPFTLGEAQDERYPAPESDGSRRAALTSDESPVEAVVAANGPRTTPIFSAYAPSFDARANAASPVSIMTGRELY
jgi:rare lipoprotein A